MGFLTIEFQGNPVWRWLVAAGILLFVGFVLRVLLWRLVRKLRIVAAKTPGRFDDLIVELLDKTKFLFIFIVSLYAGALILILPELAENALRGIFIVALALLVLDARVEVGVARKGQLNRAAAQSCALAASPRRRSWSAPCHPALLTGLLAAGAAPWPVV